MNKIITYKHKDCFVHNLSGLTKLIFFLLWTLTSMLTYDTRVLLTMLIISFGIFKVSKTEWTEVKYVLYAVFFFLCINVLAIFFFSPYEGCKIYGTKNDIIHLFGNYSLTKEQLFYEANIILKYFTIVPAVFMFLTATNPSEFASSLNKTGLPYSMCYAVTLALRYIPDVQSDFAKIKNAQEARGIEMSEKASISSRIKNLSLILFPLIFTSIERIDTVSNAMELRGFGKKNKRSWYSYKKLEISDFIVIAVTVLFTIIALLITFHDGNRFYNPFI